MNDVMQEIYRNVVKFGMKCSVIPATNEEPYILLISVGFDGSANKYILTPDGPVRLYTSPRKSGCIKTIPFDNTLLRRK